MKNKKILKIIKNCIDTEEYQKSKKSIDYLIRKDYMSFMTIYSYGRNAGLYALLSRFEEEIKNDG